MDQSSLKVIWQRKRGVCPLYDVSYFLEILTQSLGFDPEGAFGCRWPVAYQGPYSSTRSLGRQAAPIQ